MTRKQWIMIASLGAINVGIIAALAIWMIPRLAPRPSPTARLLSSPAPSLPPPLLPSPSLTSSPAPFLPSPSAASPSALPPQPSPLASPCVITATGGLATEIYNIMQAMPGPGSEGMRIPTGNQQAVWELLVVAVMRGDTATACALIRTQGFPYHLIHYTDVRNANETYWMLKENEPITAGWGVYVFRIASSQSAASPQFADSPELVIEIPHPVSDWRTDAQGVEVFRQTRARALLIAGTHRCANTSYAACTGKTMACGGLESYRTSDPAHADQTMFQAAHRALVPCGSGTVALQFHANSLANCPDLFISNGTLFPGHVSRAIYDAAVKSCGDFTSDLANGVGTSGAGECAFTAGSNVQAVYSNACAANPTVDVCRVIPLQPANPEQFISFEQSTALREDYTCLVQAIQKVFP